jgi:hypothetical protein
VFSKRRVGIEGMNGVQDAGGVEEAHRAEVGGEEGGALGGEGAGELVGDADVADEEGEDEQGAQAADVA